MTAAPPDIGPELDVLLDKVPELRATPRTVTALEGGLTNRNYKVATPQGTYVARVSPRESDALSIDRDNEYENSLRAAAAGVGAPVTAYRPQDGLLVVGFIEGVTFGDADLKRPGNIERVAQACRRLHEGERFVNDFDMFRIQRAYLEIVHRGGMRLPEGYDDHQSSVERIRAALRSHDEGTVPCNNDLLAANFIDDGTRVRIIDYEYAGNNDACFELGNIWSECHLSLDELTELIQAYYGKPLRHKLARAQLQGLMSRYGWTLWASIQSSSSSLDFDFWSWGLEKYDAAVAVFTSPAFDRLLDDAQRTD